MGHFHYFGNDFHFSDDVGQDDIRLLCELDETSPFCLCKNNIIICICIEEFWIQLVRLWLQWWKSHQFLLRIGKKHVIQFVSSINPDRKMVWSRAVVTQHVHVLYVYMLMALTGFPELQLIRWFAWILRKGNYDCECNACEVGGHWE